jgi:hypothetical protein
MYSRGLGLALVFVLGAALEAFPCSVTGPLPTPEALVRQASVIMRARVEGLVDSPGNTGFPGAQTPSQVRFRVVDVLKGAYSSEELTINGRLERADDWNDRAVPYDFVRRGGRRGNCFALGYKEGAEYLLLLRAPHQAADGTLSPYWSALGPTNEQVRGADDPWVRWVVGHLGAKPGGLGLSNAALSVCDFSDRMLRLLHDLHTPGGSVAPLALEPLTTCRCTQRPPGQNARTRPRVSAGVFPPNTVASIPLSTIESLSGDSSRDFHSRRGPLDSVQGVGSPADQVQQVNPMSRRPAAARRAPGERAPRGATSCAACGARHARRTAAARRSFSVPGRSVSG